MRTLNAPGDRGHIGVNHDVRRPQREVTAQVVVSGAVVSEIPARGLGHPVAHHQEHRVGEARRFNQQPPGYLVSHQGAMLDLHLGTAGLDHQVDPFVGHAGSLPGLNPQLCESIDKKALRVHGN